MPRMARAHSCLVEIKDQQKDMKIEEFHVKIVGFISCRGSGPLRTLKASGLKAGPVNYEHAVHTVLLYVR